MAGREAYNLRIMNWTVHAADAKGFWAAALLLAFCAPALTQAGPKLQSCKYSFGFMYTDKLGNKYESVQGKELQEIQQRIAKKHRGEVCLIDEGVPDYIFSVRAEEGSRLLNGNELYFNRYTLELHRGKDPFELEHVFARSSHSGIREPSENKGNHHRLDRGRRQVVVRELEMSIWTLAMT